MDNNKRNKSIAEYHLLKLKMEEHNRDFFTRIYTNKRIHIRLIIMACQWVRKPMRVGNEEIRIKGTN